MKVRSFLLTVSCVVMYSSLASAQVAYAPAQAVPQAVPQMAYSGNYPTQYPSYPMAVQPAPQSYYAAPQQAAPMQARPAEEEKAVNLMEMSF